MEAGLISVDRWTAGSQVYFLTHLHSDHTRGLCSSWSRGPLFCSRLTAKLFPFKFPNFNLSLLRLLEIGTWHSISLVSPSTGGETVVEVMAIDAHHCPGAIMLLFRGDFGCMLYTGDFRWEAMSDRANKGKATLVKALKDGRVDILYLDNTYCNPSYAFPPREIAAKEIIDIISAHPEHDIIIGIDSLGKEDLLLQISRTLKTKIWVWPERLQIMHLLGYHDVFTTKTALTKVRAIPRYSFSIETLVGLNSMRPTIGIMASGLPWIMKPVGGDCNLFGSLITAHHHERGRMAEAGAQKNLESVKRFHKYMYSVPYSDHSCFEELQEFINLVQPTGIRGIVSSSSCHIDPLYFFGRLCEAQQPARGPHQDYKRKRKNNEFIEGQSKSLFSNSTNSRKIRERRAKLRLLGARISRVSALRRVRRGVKIVDSD